MDPVPEYNKAEDLPLAERQKLLGKIEELRERRVISFFNFDRRSDPTIHGLESEFDAETKGPLFRVLKETVKSGEKIDIILYTRGGDTNAVWPIVSLLREYDPDFQVLVPFRCHSSGTLVALAAKKIVMTPIGELSPIDPTTGNQFNPIDSNTHQRLGISVEDVRAYREFVLEQLTSESHGENVDVQTLLSPFLDLLINQVHPIALGNVHRVLKQIKQLADKLLLFHIDDEKKRAEIIDALTTQFYSHLHMINRIEAAEILGHSIEQSTPELSQLLDSLLRGYEVHFCLRRDFFIGPYMGDEPRKEARFISGAIESTEWSYLLETNVIVSQSTVFPQNIQLQIPAGQPMPIVPGLPRQYSFETRSRGWTRNLEPKGFTR